MLAKSTFIRSVSLRTPKVADYPFTTLVPNFRGRSPRLTRQVSCCRYPWLIEGASDVRCLVFSFETSGTL